MPAQAPGDKLAPKKEPMGTRPPQKPPIYTPPPPNTPAHIFAPSGAAYACLICGAPPEHPIHDLTTINQERRGVGGQLNSQRQGQYVTLAATPPIEHTGTMVALFPDAETAGKLAVEGGESVNDLHLTLAYLPDFDIAGADLPKLLASVEGFARSRGPLTGEVAGTGRFNKSDNGPVHYAAVDLAGLPDFRESLVRILSANGFKVADNHGFTPHMTLAYGDEHNGTGVDNHPLEFSQISVASGATRHHFPLGLPEQEAAAAGTEQEDFDAAKVAAGIDAAVDQAGVLLRSTPDLPPYAAQARDLLQGIEPACDELLEYFNVVDADEPEGPEDADLDPAGQPIIAAVTTSPVLREGEAIEFNDDIDKAFVTSLHGKTLITGPAQTYTRAWEQAATPNKYFLWMEGRFVGGEKANRNNSVWTTADLEMGNPTVKHGPLNWLHQSKHVIGSIADSKLVSWDHAKDEGVDQPYITAMAGIWRWIYPDEAAVVEMASDSGKLWYSMECVAREVACVGENGCGATYPFMDVMLNKASVCGHLRDRAATRRMVDPTFLGGAVIVPPVRPGWVHSDARVMAEAASIAEKSYEQAGRPDMPAIEWEQLMANIVRYSRS